MFLRHERADNNDEEGGELYGSARAHLDNLALAAPVVVAMMAAVRIFRHSGVRRGKGSF